MKSLKLLHYYGPYKAGGVQLRTQKYYPRDISYAITKKLKEYFPKAFVAWAYESQVGSLNVHTYEHVKNNNDRLQCIHVITDEDEWAYFTFLECSDGLELLENEIAESCLEGYSDAA